MRLCAVSVDLDEIPNYFRIHGLEPGKGQHGRLRRGDRPPGGDRGGGALPLTLFAVGSDLGALMRPSGSRGHGHGHEIANHSLDHRYDLDASGAERSPEQIAGRRDDHASDGRGPVGFRAPGTRSPTKSSSVLTELGVAYDSSVFPCPSYWAAKAAEIGMIRSAAETAARSSITPASSSRRRAHTASGRRTGRAAPGCSSSRSR